MFYKDFSKDFGKKYLNKNKFSNLFSRTSLFLNYKDQPENDFPMSREMKQDINTWKDDSKKYSSMSAIYQHTDY